MRLDIELADGSRVTFRPGDTYNVESANTFARLGDSATRRIYPKAYVPSDTASLEGRRVRIEGFGNDPTDVQWHIIWLE